jgi:DNA-binding NarL/FixJ family response regulator
VRGREEEAQGPIARSIPAPAAECEIGPDIALRGEPQQVAALCELLERAGEQAARLSAIVRRALEQDAPGASANGGAGGVGGVAHADESAGRDAARADESAGPDAARAAGATLAAHDPLGRLTPREREVLGLVREGLASKEIARRLGISSATVRCHVQNVLTKLGVYSRLQAAALTSGRGGGGGGGGGGEMSEPQNARLRTLTRRETQVLQALAGGMERKEIAARLYVSPHTVRTHVQRVLAKLGVHSVVGAMAVARRAGLSPL